MLYVLLAFRTPSAPHCVLLAFKVPPAPHLHSARFCWLPASAFLALLGGGLPKLAGEESVTGKETRGDASAGAAWRPAESHGFSFMGSSFGNRTSVC